MKINLSCRVRTALLALSSIGSGSAEIWNANLVVNPGAENGAGIASIGAGTVPVKDVPGWTIAGSFTVAQYVGGTALTVSSYGPKDRGKQYFYGGLTGGTATAVQTIDVAEGAAEIDAGRARFYLSGYLANGGVQAVATKLKATFLDAAGKTLLEYAVTGPTASESSNTGNRLLWRSGSGFLLPNTRKVQILIDLSRTTTGRDDAAADNVALTLALEPILGTNLVVNGDAELSDPVLSGVTPIPGWNGDTEFTATTYARTNITASLPGPDDRGKNVLWSTCARNDTSAAYQTIDVTLAKDRIDSGAVTFTIGAWLGGDTTNSDDTTVKALFLDAAGKQLAASAALGPVTQQDRGGKSAMLLRTADGSLPPGTRLIQVNLTFANHQSAVNSMRGYTDSVVMVLKGGGSVAIQESGIVNSATGAFGPIAAGEMVTIYTSGINLAATTRMQLDAAGRVVTSLGNARVFFDGTQAPLLYVNSSQIGAVVPFDVDGKGAVAVRVEYQGVASAVMSMRVAGSSPGIFTQDGGPKGAGLILNPDYSLNSKDNPAVEGSVVTIYWTGGGQTDPGGVDGQMSMPPLARPKAAIGVTVGGRAAGLVYAGSVPYGWAGLLVAEAVVPGGAGSADAVPVVITADSASSPDNAVVMWVRGQ